MALQNLTQLFTPSFFNNSTAAKNVGDEFVFCDNGNVVFHWSDFYETCDLMKSQIESSPIMLENFKNRESALKRLALIPVWVRTETKIHQTTMHELYEKYILDQAHLLGGLDPFCPMEISFICATGPFKDMSIADCFNKTTYRDFVHTYLLKGQLPRRDYRLRLRSKVLLEYGHDFNQAEVVSLEQLTLSGMLFSMDSETFMKKLSDLNHVRILINTKMLESGLGNNIDELKAHLSQFSFNFLYSSNKEDSMPVKLSDFSVQSSFDFSKNKRVYLFASYDKLAENQPIGVKTIREFVNHTKNLVLSHYQQGLIKQRSA